MSFQHALAPACWLVATGLVAAQTAPPQQSQPIKPAPTGQTKIEPSPTGQISTYPPPLYRMNDVSKSLSLTQDQVNRLNGVTDKVQGQYRDLYGKLGSLNADERFTRLQELNRQYNTDWSKAATDIFDNDQRLRYEQLTQQYGGFTTLYDPAVQKRLNLTPEQVKGLRDQVDWTTLQLNAVNKTAVTDPTRAGSQYRDYWKQQQDRLNKFLAPDQVKTWREMTGEPYVFQPIFPTPNPPPPR